MKKLRKGEYGEWYDDKGRVCTAKGTPLRNADMRTVVVEQPDGSKVTRSGIGVPFHGLSGKPNRKGEARRDRRVKVYEDQQGGKVAPSNRHDRHRPGSLTK